MPCYVAGGGLLPAGGRGRVWGGGPPPRAPRRGAPRAPPPRLAPHPLKNIVTYARSRLERVWRRTSRLRTLEIKSDPKLAPINFETLSYATVSDASLTHFEQVRTHLHAFTQTTAYMYAQTARFGIIRVQLNVRSYTYVCGECACTIAVLSFRHTVRG